VNGALSLRTSDGFALALHRNRWMGPASPADLRLLGRILPPVLDVGCGPGRLIRALAERGIVALGIDAAPSAVDIAGSRGLPVLRRSIFERIPGAGRWGSALLVDGSVGIGGDPEALLRRIAGLLRPGGRVLVEAEPPGAPTGTMWARIENGGEVGPTFPWARVGIDRLAQVARPAGLRAAETWSADRRWFGVLDRP
jgi:SAM-dependent methyltransferase